MRRCVPHRQRLLASASLTSLSLGVLGLRQEGCRLHDHAVDAVAALHRLLGDEGALHRRGCSSDPRPSRVMIAASPTDEAGVMQERTASPSISTVQAPHWPGRSRSAARAGRDRCGGGRAAACLGRRLATSTDLPFTLSLMGVTARHAVLRSGSGRGRQGQVYRRAIGLLPLIEAYSVKGGASSPPWRRWCRLPAQQPVQAAMVGYETE